MTTHASTVRLATPEDHDDLWRLLLMSHRENSLFPISHKKVEWHVQRALFPNLIHPADPGPRMQIGAIGPKGKLEGIAFLMIGTFWYSESPHIEELMVYVDPECRRSNHARALIDWMKLQADELGIPLITGILSRDRTAAKIRLYDRVLPRIGAFYAYPMKGMDVKKRNHNMEKDAWLKARELSG